MEEKPKIVSADELPDDPLSMPPPYWRGGDASFQLIDALERLVDFLHELLPIHTRTDELRSGLRCVREAMMTDFNWQ